ncbi:MAG: UbiH/UbiF/VisC/COQ6 family ubiquinone biosynthesis hydroxylase [Halieaceae bacterium]
MVEPRDFDVVVVGAGIAGSALALALSGNGLRIALVEARPLSQEALPEQIDLSSFDPRVSALTPRSQSALARLGAWPGIVDYRPCAYRHMTVWDAEGTGEIDFDASEVDAGELGHIVENRSVTQALLQQVLAAPDISVVCPASLVAAQRDESGHIEISLEDGTSLRADLMVAADGALSPVRDLLGFATREWDYGHRAIVTTVAVEHCHQHTAWQRFLPSGPLAFLPLPEGNDKHFCSIVWSLQDELVDDLMAQDDEAFCLTLGDAIEHRLGAVQECAQRYAFPLRQRHAIDYVQPGVALVGDAAHTIHPLAGQGINLGLLDVMVLAEEVLASCEAGGSPGTIETLRRYQRRRKGDNLLMMAAMDGFKRLFEQQAPPIRWLRNAGMRQVGRMLPVKREIIRRAMGIGE